MARLHEIFAGHYQAAFPKTAKAEVLNAAYYILSQNILCGDALKLQTANGEPIVFAEWKAVNGRKIKRRDYVFSDLGEEAYIPEPVKDDYPAVNFWELGK